MFFHLVSMCNSIIHNVLEVRFIPSLASLIYLLWQWSRKQAYMGGGGAEHQCIPCVWRCGPFPQKAMHRKPVYNRIVLTSTMQQKVFKHV